MAGWVGGIGIKAKLRPAGAGAWPELGKNENNSLGEGKFFILEKVLGDLLFWFIFCLLIFFILEIFKYNISKISFVSTFIREVHHDFESNSKTI